MRIVAVKAWPVSFPVPESGRVSLGIGTLLGLVAGVFPAVRAARVPPAEALRA